MIYIAKTLNLDKLQTPNKNIDLLNFELGCRLWWFLLVVDWFEDSTVNRTSQIGIHDFTTPRPRNISDFNLVNSIEKETDNFIPISYNLYIYDLCKIKKIYYFKDSGSLNKNILLYLKLANVKIQELEKKYFESDSSELMDMSKFLLHVKFVHEKLQVNRQIVGVKDSLKDQFEDEINVCSTLSLSLIEKFNDMNIPNYYRKYCMVSEHCINGAIFVLINMIIHQELIDVKQIKIIQEFVIKLE